MEFQTLGNKKIMQGIKGDALFYFARKAGNLEFLEKMIKFDNLQSISQDLGIENEYDAFSKYYKETIKQKSLADAQPILDDFNLLVLEKICFPNGLN